MRKTTAFLAIAVCVSLCGITLAQSNSGTVDPGAPSARSEVRDRLTIQRILRDRIEFTLRLARTMRLLEPPAPVDESAGYTNGIIDEPDPAGNTFKRDEREDEREGRRRRHEEQMMNSGTSGGVPTEMTFRH